MCPITRCLRCAIHISTVAVLFFGSFFDVPSAYSTEDDLQEIRRLEAQVFDARLVPREVESLLEDLLDAEKRPIAVRKLGREAQGFQERIITCARRTSNLEVRHACVDVIAAIDGAYRTTESGRQLGALYHKHTHSLAMTRWKQFRDNPLDLRAVAMLVHGDPEVIYELLGNADMGREQVRYLLLRLRELAKDDFVRRHITKVSAAKIHLVIPDVFPCHLSGSDVGVHRIVGNVTLNLVEVPSPEITRKSAGSPASKPIAIRFQRRRTYLFKCPAHYRPGQYEYGYVVLQRWTYYDDAIAKKPVVHLNERLLRSASPPQPGLTNLPELEVSKAQRSNFSQHAAPIPWWVKPYMPPALRNEFRFRRRRQKETVPRLVAADPMPVGIAPATETNQSAAPPDDAPSIVVLQPRVSEGEREEVRFAGELICDRLAQELDRLGQCHIVDRTQLDNILREKKIDLKIAAPLASYDGMIRVEIHTARPQPQLHLGVLDLSNGNLIKKEIFAWPGREQDVPRMVEFCRSAIATLVRPQQGRLRVRLVGVEGHAAEDRIAPLRRKLQSVVRRSLQRSPKVVLMDHLSAHSSKEEALFLMMGISELPNGRQFVPQADATITFRVQEHSMRGVSFEKTRITVGCRLKQASDRKGNWIDVQGDVSEFDALLDRLWGKLAAALEGVDPATGHDYLEGLAERRRQAEAELAVAKRIHTDSEREPEVRAGLARCNAALKIDPTFQEAAVMRITMLGKLAGHLMMRDVNSDSGGKVILAAAQYTKRFEGHPEYFATIQASAWTGAMFSSLAALARNENIEPTAENRRLLDASKQIVDHAFSGDIRCLSNGATVPFTTVVYRGMRLCDVPLALRIKWLENVLTQASRQEKQIGEIPASDRDTYIIIYQRLRTQAAEMLAEDRQFDRAKKIIALVQDRYNGHEHRGFRWSQMRRSIVSMDDPKALVEFDAWSHPYLASAQLTKFMQIEWPSVDADNGQKAPSVPHTQISKNYHTSIAALADAGDRLYVVTHPNTIGWSRFAGNSQASPSQVIGYISLDAEGRPTSTQIKKIPQPKVREFLQATMARQIGSKLYVGTTRCGLLEFDPTTNRWRIFGPDQGLPAWPIYSFFPLDESKLYCTTEARISSRPGVISNVMTHFTFNTKTGEVQLVHRTDREKKRYFERRLVHLWRDGEKLMAWTSTALRDDLLAEDPQRLPPSSGGAYGWTRRNAWGPRTVVEIDGRHFMFRGGGMQEFDAAGQVVQSWWNRGYVSMAVTPRVGQLNTIVAPRDCPVQSIGVRAGELIVTVGRRGLMTGYNPRNDTWYGPLAARGDHVLGARGGAWLGGGTRLTFVASRDLMVAAQRSGRVLTTAQFRQRTVEIIRAMPLMKQAKLAFAMRQFDKAASRLTAVLDSDSSHAEALLLMGYLRHRWYEQDPDAAIGYYQRLAAIEKSDVRLTGLYMSLNARVDQKRWQEAIKLAEQIGREFPRIDPDAQRNVNRWLWQAKKSEEGAQ